MTAITAASNIFCVASSILFAAIFAYTGNRYSMLFSILFMFGYLILRHRQLVATVAELYFEDRKRVGALLDTFTTFLVSLQDKAKEDGGGNPGSNNTK